MKIHQILTGKDFPYEYYLSVISALKVHQPEEYNLWLLEEPDSAYYNLIKDKITIHKIAFDFLPDCASFEDFAKLPAFAGKDTHFVSVHLKDLLAWKILYEVGGLTMDLDTLSIQNCTQYFDECKTAHLFLHGLPHPDAFNNAIMIAKPDSKMMGEMYSKSLERLSQDKLMEWGDIGPTLLNEVVKGYKGNDADSISYINVCCVVDGNGMGKIIKWFSDDGYVWDSCRMLHTYGSSDYSKWVKSTTPIDESFIFKSRSPYAKLVKEILEPEEWNPLGAKQPHSTIRRVKTFHIPGLPHVPTNKDNLSCAYTQKTLKLCSMLKSLGHRVYFYGLEDSTVECDEFIQVATKADLEKTYGIRDDTNQFYDLSYGHVQQVFFENAIREINRRKNGTDFFLSTYGWGQKPIADGVGLPLTVESGIGYRDTFAKYRVFESYAWMHYVYGILKQDDGSNYDCVIPNYFDPKDFKYSDQKGDYFLYLGRIINRKGIEIAIQAVGDIGGKLKIAGQGCSENINLNRPHIEYVGYAGVEKRKELLSKAKALLVPTIYIGPFEGVHIEAGMSGTPVITSDWGVFGESVLHGITGYRCRTFEQFTWACNNIDRIRPEDCYKNAINNYSMDRVRWMYEEYFDMLYDLSRPKQWYTARPERSDYESWQRYYPS